MCILCLLFPALETPKRKSLTRHLKEGRMNRSWSEDDIDINTDTTVEILQVILNELENKMNELYSNDKSPHRRKNALICNLVHLTLSKWQSKNCSTF